ncbi:hypothetical protein FA13DRAFT_1766001 [Coprinellus micaceus]|uniref:FAR-17a/AIG1-like protein n=1 Tax=Coprinellus micaceus TaxID=71717 RepID=A0A4Y7SSF6_COPMI|nr:hypothetical protein FA13DRAFT_1766001 [Coprinellus micaceus]
MTDPTTFDQKHELVTSYLFKPIVLAGLRLLFAVFTLATILATLIWQGVHRGAESCVPTLLYFSFFTNLTYIGICAYMFASGVQTYAFAQSLKKGGGDKSTPSYPLQRWPKVLQHLHVLLYATIATFPIIVTVVYWALLGGSDSFSTMFSSYSNITKHALNSFFCVFEIALTNVGPLRWIDLPATILILAGYVGVAYITYHTQHFYPYSFLDPKEQGKLVAAYIVGIAVGQVVVFVIVWGLIKLRVHLVQRSKSSPDVQSEKPKSDLEA